MKLSAETNRNVIGKRLPNTYLPEMIAKNGIDHTRSILESHFISSVAQEILLRDPFGSKDFEDFIAERRRTIQQAIENLLIKERLHLPPNLRSIDADIEEVELDLRKSINITLGGDEQIQIPSHLLQKVEERISRAIKKNAALDSDYYQSLEGKLEYFDLRELQDTITSKALWPKFELLFRNKETLIAKFGQLAELRNSIRHSRTVDEIICKEGEAANLWFKQVLSK